MIIVINKNNAYHQKIAARDHRTVIYVGRGSILGNKFYMRDERDREQCIAEYKRWLWSEMKQQSAVLNEIRRIAQLVLSGQKVALECFCAPRKCHAEVIMAAVNWLIQASRPQPPAPWGVNTEPFAAIIEMAQRFDWTFEMSDDHSVWKRGNAATGKLKNAIKALSDTQRIELWPLIAKHVPAREDNGADFGIWVRRMFFKEDDPREAEHKAAYDAM